MSARLTTAGGLLSLTLALAACGGGGGGSSPAAPGTQAPGRGTERIVITIPHDTPSSARGRTPRYISIATQSVKLIVPGAAPVTLALTSSNPNCVQTQSALVCTVDLPVPIGTTTVTISTYASTDGTGTPLSTATLSITVVGGQVTTLDVTLNPVVSGMSMTVGTGQTLVVPGTPSTTTLLVTPVDAAGRTIIGPGAYVDAAGNPVTITITDSDTSGATSVSPKMFGSPADGNTVTVNYNGATISNFTVTSSVSSSTFASLPFTVKPPGQVVYVGGYPCGASNTRPQTSIGEFAAPANGSTTLGANLGSVTASGQADAIGVNRHGDVFMDFVGAVNRYAPNAVGTPSPVASVNLPANEQSFAMAADSTGGFWVSALDNAFTTSFLHYAANANGNALPDRTVTGIAGLPAGYNLTDSGLALDSHDNVYVVAVSSSSTPRVYELAPTANGSAVTPIASFAFGATDGAPRLTVDQHTDTLWKYPVNVFSGTVKISSSGMSAVPNATFPSGRLLYTRNNGDTYRPFSLALDDAGNVYAAFAAGGNPGGPCNSLGLLYVWGSSAGAEVTFPAAQAGNTFAVTIPPLTTP